MFGVCVRKVCVCHGMHPTPKTDAKSVQMTLSCPLFTKLANGNVTIKQPKYRSFSWQVLNHANTPCSFAWDKHTHTELEEE